MVRPRVEPAYPAGLVRHGGLAICLVVGRSGSLVLVEGPLHLGGQRRLQSAGFGGEGRHAGAGAGKDHAVQPRRLTQGVLQRQPPAPRVAEEVEPIQAEGVTDGADLIDEGVMIHKARSSGWSDLPQPSWS